MIEAPIEFFSLCEHHALPFHGHAYIGYIAHEEIIGIFWSVDPTSITITSPTSGRSSTWPRMISSVRSSLKAGFITDRFAWPSRGRSAGPLWFFIGASPKRAAGPGRNRWVSSFETESVGQTVNCAIFRSRSLAKASAGTSSSNRSGPMLDISGPPCRLRTSWPRFMGECSGAVPTIRSAIGS
jgi:hypothetical protein